MNRPRNARQTPINAHFTVAAGYGHFGTVLNHSANGVWGITTKFEF